MNTEGSKPFGTGPEAYLRFHHGNNTWHEQHIMRHAYWNPKAWTLPEDQADYLRAVIDEHYSFARPLSRADQLALLREKEKTEKRK